DWPVAGPELPERAVGLGKVRVAAPPAPPLTSAVATAEPPRPRTFTVPAAPVTLLNTTPARVALAVAPAPPAPPAPPETMAVVSFSARPVPPEPAMPTEVAPELVVEVALPPAAAAPVLPLLPLKPPSVRLAIRTVRVTAPGGVTTPVTVWTWVVIERTT